MCYIEYINQIYTKLYLEIIFFYSGQVEVVSAPSHPRNLTVSPGEDNDAVLTWNASEEDGGRSIEIYEVFQCSVDDGGVGQKKTRIHASSSDDNTIYTARLMDLEYDVKYRLVASCNVCSVKIVMK